MTSDPRIACSRSTRTAASSSVTACMGNARRRGAVLPAARASELTGNVGVTVRTTWPLPFRRCNVELDPAGAISIRCTRDPG